MIAAYSRLLLHSLSHSMARFVLLCSIIVCVGFARVESNNKPSTPSSTQSRTQSQTQDSSDMALADSTLGKPPSSRVFVGIGSMIALQYHSTPNLPSNTTATYTSKTALSISARGGYQYELFNILAARLYLDYTMSVQPVGIESLITTNFLINTDISYYTQLLSHLRGGFVAGLGLGYGTYGKEVREDPNSLDSITAKGFSAFCNGGLGLEFYNAHRLEFLVKYPLTTLELPHKIAYKEIHLLLMYDYIF